MSKLLKTFHVKTQEEAFLLINRLSEQYHMQQDSTRHQFTVSNGRYSAYYDADENMVKIEALHPHTTEEEIREFLLNFPPFF